MFSVLRRRLTYANIAATLALVFAMSGGAYAASKYLITSTKQISPKVLKSLKGANGKGGAAGPAGAAGPQGPAGAVGAKGETGAVGGAGANGVSVTSAEVAKSSATCNKQGGSEFTSASGKATACNGKEGSPWTAGGTLPSGKTETGAWAFGPLSAAAVTGGGLIVPISFAIPLASPLDASHVHYINENGQEVTGITFKEEKAEETTAAPTECLGTVEAPSAQPGNLCVYTAAKLNAVASSESIGQLGTGSTGASTAGAALSFETFGGGGAQHIGKGTWAVTG
jgi:hypothetical protein